MKLLMTHGSDSEDWQPQLVDFRGEKYAILSHCWLEEPNDEVLYADIRILDDGGRVNPTDENDLRRHTKYQYNPNFSRRSTRDIPGYDKLKGAARQAAREDHDFIWVDTCCIDKSSSAELSEAINSMFNWYHKSNHCFAYLADVPDGPDGQDTSINSAFAKAKWWTRGWTLQELVAPFDVVFYTRGWERIGEKKSLGGTIYAISGIGIDVLTHARALDDVSVARRMSWASSRKTTRTEDLAYSLMGIFSVNMPLLYGEGEKAFLRLQEEIIKSSDDESIFAWVDPLAQDDEPRGLLASSPAHFSKSSEIIFYQDFENREPYVMGNRGLSITLHLSRCEDGKIAAALHCPVAHTGDGFLAVFLQRLGEKSQHFARVKCSKLGSLRTRGVLETIYVRQSHKAHQLNRVLPYHFFNLRHLTVGGEDEHYQLMQIIQGPLYESGTVNLPFPTSYGKQWIRRFPGCFRVIRGERKLAVALLFGQVLDETKSMDTTNASGPVAVMLGSTSTTEVSFDAHEMNRLLPFDSMDKIFKPTTAGQWKELENFHVKVDFEPQVSGSSQLFLTDITISKIVRTTPFDQVVDALAHRLEPYVPPLRETSAKSRWQRLMRDR